MRLRWPTRRCAPWKHVWFERARSPEELAATYGMDALDECVRCPARRLRHLTRTAPFQ